jgi:hypothetical protein
MDPSFHDTLANGLVIAEVASLHPFQHGRDLGGSSFVETFKPFRERTMPIVPDVFNDFKHFSG